ncbi:CBS domain-containing protein [Marmoricola sp. RAF53]|uniref:CBS domain-containing protein n=1 Tax=Marmoricola sp. RAF53 TaxID=3233059 RepID=UPI003F961353
MLVREVMTSSVVSVSPGTTLKQVLALLAEHRVTALPVLDDTGRLVGVVSEADVLAETVVPDQRAHERPVEPGPGPGSTRVEQVMSRHLLTVPPAAEVAEAAALMIGSTVKSLPVIERGRLVGMISRRDLVAVLARGDAAIEAEVDELVRASGYDWTAEVDDGVVLLDGPSRADERAIAKVLVGSVPGVLGLRFPDQRRG